MSLLQPITTHTHCLSVWPSVDYSTRTEQMYSSPIFHARWMKTHRCNREDVRGNKSRRFLQHSQSGTTYAVTQSSAFFVSQTMSAPTECLASISTMIPTPTTPPPTGWLFLSKWWYFVSRFKWPIIAALLLRFQHCLSNLGGPLHMFVSMTKLPVSSTSWRNCIYCYVRRVILMVSG